MPVIRGVSLQHSLSYILYKRTKHYNFYYWSAFTDILMTTNITGIHWLVMVQRIYGSTIKFKWAAQGKHSDTTFMRTKSIGTEPVRGSF